MSEVETATASVKPVDTNTKNIEDNSGKKLSLGALFRSGSIIVPDIKIWSGTTKLQPADLGVPDTQEVRDSLNFGTERLVPKELLSPLLNSRTTAHNLIKGCSANFPFFPGQKFTPKALVGGLEASLKLVQEEFYQHKNNNVVPKFQEEALKQLKRTEEALLKATEGKPNSREIVDMALERIKTKLPDEKTLDKKFFFSWVRRSVDFPKDGALDAMDAAEKETETVKENIESIVKDYSSRVMILVNNIKEIAAKGKKPTVATLNSIKSLREKVSKLDAFGGKNLVAVLDSLEIFIDANIELQKVEHEKAQLELSAGIEVISDNLDEATISAINDAIDLMGASPEITL